MANWQTIGTVPTNDDIVIPGSFKQQAGLSGFGLINPQDQAVQDAQDLTPQNLSSLDTALQEAKSPAAIAALSQEKQRLDAAKQDNKWETIGSAPKENSWETIGSAPDPSTMGDLGTGSSDARMVIDTAKNIYNDPEGAALGVVHGLYSGAMQGLNALSVATPFGMAKVISQGMKPSDIAAQGEKYGNTFKDALQPQFRKQLETSLGSEAAQQILGIPFMPITKAADYLKAQGHPELAAAFVGAISGGAMLMGMRGPKVKGSALEEVPPAEPPPPPADGGGGTPPKTGDAYTDALNGSGGDTPVVKPKIRAKGVAVEVPPDASVPGEATPVATEPVETPPADSMAATDSSLATSEAPKIEPQELSTPTEPPPADKVSVAPNTQPGDPVVPDKVSENALNVMRKSQGGAVNFGVADEVAARLKVLKDNLLNISRDRDIKVGDTVRLMNGKTGVITDVVNDRFQIKGKDFQDSVPVQGIDYKYKPSGQVTSNIGYPDRNPNAGKFGQGGALNPDLIPDFWKWFGKSTLKDGEGKPKVMYHGTSKDVPFKNLKGSKRGIFLTDDPEVASSYAKTNDSMDYKPDPKPGNPWNMSAVNTASRVMPVYARLENPYRLTEADIEPYRRASNYAKAQREIAEKAKLAGHDGVIYPDGGTVVFDSDQVKSALSVDKPLGGVGKKGFGQGGVVKITNLLKGDDPTIDADRPKGVNIPYTAEGIQETLHRLYSQSSSINDFIDSLGRERRLNTAFPERAIDDAEIWWKKFQNGWIPEKSTYGKMSLLNRRESSDPRGYASFVKEVMGREIPRTSDDIGYLTREGFAPQHLAQLGFERKGTQLIKWAYSRLADIRLQAKVKLGELLDMQKPFLDLPRKSMLRVLKAQWEWDSGRFNDMLWNFDKDGNRGSVRAWWPTKDELMQYSKLSPEEADAYISQSVAFDRMYQDAGITRPRLPGYFPHTWRGIWRVYLYDSEAGLYKVLGASTRRGAKMLANEAVRTGKDLGHKVIFDIKDPTISQNHDLVTKIQNDLLSALEGQGKLGKAAANMLIKLQESAIQGTITEEMERHGVSGYLQEGGPKPEDTAMQWLLNRRHNNSLANSFGRAMNDGVRAWKNRTITQAVAVPFFKDVRRYQNLHETTAAVKDLIEKASGFNKQEFSGLERSIRQAFINAGLPPNIPSRFLGMLNEFARVERINSANLGFAGEHAYFAIPGLLDMWRMHIDRMTMGEKTGNFVPAMTMWAKGWLPGDIFRTTDEARAFQWFKDKGGFKGGYYDSPKVQGIGGKVYGAVTHGLLQTVVNRAKSATFSMAYQYFKTIMPRTEALEAAFNHTSKTMQSFDALDTPQIFAGEGLVGKSIRPFNQIHMYGMARIAQSVDSVLLAAKHNKAMIPLALTPLIGFVAMSVMLGGASAIAFSGDFDKARKWLNENSEANIPSIEEWLLAKGLPRWLIYGIAPTMVHVPHAITNYFGLPDMPGSDTRGTFTMNAFDMFSGAGVGAAGRLAQLAYQEGKKQITGVGDADEIKFLKRQLLPTTMIPWLEDEDAKHLGGNPNEPFSFTKLGTGTGSIPELDKLNPTSPRTPGEDLEYKLLSKKPITETIRNDTVNVAKEAEARVNRINAFTNRTIVNKVLGFDTGTKSIQEIINDAVARDTGYNPKKLSEMLKQAIPERTMPAAITYLENVAKSSDDVQKAARFRRLVSILRDGKHLGE